MKRERETDILRACLDALVKLRVFHFRCNSGALKTERGGFVRFGTPGLADIICVVNGKIIACEIKASRGVQSDTQKTFQRALEKAGGVYHIVRSVDELVFIIRNPSRRGPV